MDLPIDPYFTVTYRLIPTEATSAKTVNISGVFSFMINERTFDLDIIERNEMLAGLNREQLNNILSNLNIQPTERQEIADVPQQQQQQQQQQQTQRPQPPQQQQRYSSNNTKHLLEDEKGIYYRVQIAAGHKEVNIPRYFRNYRLERDVMREDHEGWFKYTVGSFAEYKDARDYRVHTSNTTSIKDAFVVAYNDGKRITVQDALMALNQRWIR